MTGQVIVYRAGGYCDMMHGCRVVVDDEDWGTIKRKGRIALDLPPGPYGI